MHMQSPPHCFSLGAALREFVATKVGTTALFATEVPAANSTKLSPMIVSLRNQRRRRVATDATGGRVVVFVHLDAPDEATEQSLALIAVPDLRDT